MGSPKKDKSQKTSHPWYPVEIWRREWPVVKASPTTSLISFLLGCALFWFLYSTFIIPGKDATIQNLLQLNEHHALFVTNFVYLSPTSNIQPVVVIPTSQTTSTITGWAKFYSTNGQPFWVPVVLGITNSQ